MNKPLINKNNPHWQIPEEFQDKFAFEAARFINETGVSVEQVQVFLSNIFAIYGEWIDKDLKQRPS